MTWTDRLLALFDDLEMQAEGLYLEDRDREVEALAEAGYAEIPLAARVAAAVGRELRLALGDGSEVTGVLRRYGAGWLLLAGPGGDWLVPGGAVVLVEGLGSGALPTSARPRTARLSIGSVLRRLAEDEQECSLRLVGGRLVRGTVLRVGADFAVVRSGGSELAVPFTALVAVRGPR